MSTQLTAQSSPRDIKGLLNSDAMRKQFALALPRHLSADRFIRVATTALMRTPTLAECTPESFMKCMLELSAWGIEPDGRRAHLIPFKNSKKNITECTLILDWKGLAELAQRSGEIAKLHADLICEKDEFDYNLGEVTQHRINFREDRGEPYAAYAMAITKDGAIYVQVLTKQEILAVRNASQGWKSFKQGYAKQSPWDPENPSSEGEMWKKTAFRRLSKWLPLSAEFREAVEKDDADSTLGEIRNVTPTSKSIANREVINPFKAESPQVDVAQETTSVEAESSDDEIPLMAAETET